MAHVPLHLVVAGLLGSGCCLVGASLRDTDGDSDAPVVGEVPDDADVPVVFETATAGLCANGEDDDGDGLADCEDPGCAAGVACDPYGGIRDVVWPADPPDLDLVRDERASCPVAVDDRFRCSRVLRTSYCETSVLGARPGSGAELHLLCDDEGQLLYSVLPPSNVLPASRQVARQPLVNVLTDEQDPDARHACGGFPGEGHPLAFRTALFEDVDRDGTWLPTTVSEPPVLLSRLMTPESCDARIDTALTVLALRDDADEDRASVILTREGRSRVLLPEVLGRDVRVRVVPDGDDTWVAVSSEGDCTVPCLFHIDGEAPFGAPPRPISWAPSWRPPALLAPNQSEPGSFWIDDDGTPTLVWSGLTSERAQVRGVARLTDNGWVGREVKCPEDLEDRPDFSAVVDLGGSWVTGGFGQLYVVDPDTLMATRILAPGEAPQHPLDILARRGPDSLRPQGTVWSASRRPLDDSIRLQSCSLPEGGP